MLRRPRRNRKSGLIRDLVEETDVALKQLIYPLFVEDKPEGKTAVDSMPGIYRYGRTALLREVNQCLEFGVSNFVLFPAVANNLKSPNAAYGTSERNFYVESIRAIKEEFPEVIIMSDVAMDPYSSDGHDGFLSDGEILNDETIGVLTKMAVLHAEAGVDIIGPSDMMDGRVRKIRESLDKYGYTNTSIMAYTAKYASAFYGPFRDALDSAPKSGDKKTYQMNPSNRKEALLEAQLDFEEGADFLMVKPALSYLDVIKELSDTFPLPIAAYSVSGEYAMVKAASQKGWVNGEALMIEMLKSIKRAGASCILTYFAKEFASLKNR